ncbi:uncharacterized protein LOC126705795 [Quercus robur]|uniref:uncharacterized protein LOC126705795 n=1 Tax=Quercus robur TaxID=38942 RepID=UPI002162D5D7|nr:uncharacterized protein LOC126705795 [Quercus robur]
MPSRGLRQGDPLSSYLFLLCADGFSSLINKPIRRQAMSGLSICRGCPMISHLFFADDSLLFCKVNSQECQHLIDILRLYEAASGQKINIDKSLVLFSANTPEEMKVETLDILGPMQDSRHSKYLGLPSIIGKSKMDVFAEIKERVARKLFGWKEKILSIGGREILIKAVAEVIPTYTMSCFQLPKGLCDEIESMMRRFWWGQRGQESKISWVSWRKLCNSKLKGGMGFRNLQAFNLAMLAKQGWRLLENPNSLVARIYRAKYYPHGDVLKAGLGSSPSFSWRSIMQGLEVVRKGTRWTLGNGRLIHIWDDKWLSTPTTYKVVSPPPQNFDNFPMVSTLIDYDSRRWKVDLSETLFHSIIDCEVARRVWDKLEATLDILRNGTNCDLEIFFGVAWSVWYNRNQVAFESKCQMPDQIWRFARSFLHDYKGALVSLNMNPAEKKKGWTPPSPGVLKINVDGATSKDGRNSSVGAVIRDSCGAVIAACGKFLQGQFSVSEVEADR